MNRDEILKLAKEIWGPFFPSDPDNNQAFQKITYICRAAYNAGIEAACSQVHDWMIGYAADDYDLKMLERDIRKLEMK